MARIFLFCFLVLALSCKTKQTNSSEDLTSQGYQKATVLKYDVEACGYLLELESGKKIQPFVALAKEFEKDQLKVWVKFEIKKKQSPNTCMAGEIAEITDIKSRK